MKGVIGTDKPIVATCIRCGRSWQVGNRDIPYYGYVCPECMSKYRKELKQGLKSAAKWTSLWVLGIVIYHAWAHGEAYAFRGYRAVGGEFVFLALPLVAALYKLMADTIKGIMRGGKEL